ncbi:MAG: hypothetical protein DRR08_11545 [Candidatus Parabeggiatoa sp. nov. 2]|nr:MAG: hypothetical protein B6247_23845 [Beggiatoa sp. 4572_84]RKZ60346.1 MAG: hypothetical protein DRR08_11545 [Gammaproteobacteria bacterium]
MSDSTLFFTDNKKRFFRPLNSKYREVILGCLRSLYHRLYSPEAEFGYQVTREDVRDLFVQVIRETPVFTDEEEKEEIYQKATDDRAKANAIFQELLNCGWLEKYVDNMSSTYRFTRAGKAFSETIAGFEKKGLQTRQRNVRNTKNALQAFLTKNDPFDLIDAVDYAKRVASDFSDDIADLHERKQALMKDAIQKARFAIQDLLDYMDNHFSPDLAIRLSADSIVRHHNEIREIIDKIKKPWRLKKLKRTENTLKSLVFGIKESTSETPIIYQLLDQIERYLESAERIKMSELRAALESYVGRTTMLIKQATAMMAGLKEEQLAKTLQTLSKCSPEEQNQQLAQIGQHLGTLSTRLVAPNTLSLRKRQRREVAAEIQEVPPPSPEERLLAALAEAEDNAFTVSIDDIRQEILKQMGEQWTIRISELKITDAATFLALSHAIEVGSASLEKEKPRLLIEPTQERFMNGYIEADDYIIRKE